MHNMNTPDRRNAGYVSTLFASEPALLDRLVDAGHRRDAAEIDQVTDQLAVLGLVRLRSDGSRFKSKSAESSNAR